jgi:hypothetical protein
MKHRRFPRYLAGLPMTAGALAVALVTSASPARAAPALPLEGEATAFIKSTFLWNYNAPPPGANVSCTPSSDRPYHDQRTGPGRAGLQARLRDRRSHIRQRVTPRGRPACGRPASRISALLAASLTCVRKRCGCSRSSGGRLAMWIRLALPAMALSRCAARSMTVLLGSAGA